MDGPEPTGVLVLRVWIEGDGNLRARITCSPDLSPERERTFVASSIEEIDGIIRDFVSDFEASHS
jgi:hypothetical protein